MLRAKLGLTRSNQVTEMLRTSVPPCVVAVFLIMPSLVAKRRVAKQSSLRRSISTPRCQIAETPNAQSAPTADERSFVPCADDEIAVDGYVMKPEVRGTSRDPRALKDEQWIVKVRMLDDGRTFQVPADQAKWEKLRENDRVKVRYRTGKYTGTVWAAEIE